MAEKNRLSDMARGATEVNLRFTASLLNLSRDYLRTMRDTLMEKAAPEDADDGSEPQPVGDVPMLIAGRRGETGNAAFTVSNASKRDGAVTLECRGEFGGAKVETDPQKLEMKSGEVATVRVLAGFDASLPLGEDVAGSVVIPELDRTVARFVLRRLPDRPASRKKRGTKKKVSRRKKAG